MASYEAICVSCGKPFRRSSGVDTIDLMRESPAIHRPGSEGDEGCQAAYQKTLDDAATAEHEAQVAAARALVEAEDAPKGKSRS